MASSGAVWGIDVGQVALKAVKVRAAGEGQNEIVAFDVIEHAKLLSQPDADQDELIRQSVEKFAARNEWQKDQIILGVPGQQSFARFCKLPPLESKKKIPDLVRFEASQQIPFDMDDVVWDYQIFSDDESPETEVGIFAMRKDLVRKWIDAFNEAGIQPAGIQTLPSALFNFAALEYAPEDEEHAVVIVDVGAQNTDLIVVEQNSAWMRNIPLGGNNFTEALVKGFKLSFSKAENLKRTAASSKYARQIFQAMRPIFAELVAEIQRSLGFYSSTHRDVELTKVIAMGNAFQLPGLQKYLENNLTIEGGVLRPEKFATLTAGEALNADEVNEKILSFAPAYGLALQGLGQSKITSNLLPTELARLAVWRQKTPFWMASAAALAIAAVVPFTRSFLDSQALAASENESALRQAQQIINAQQSKQSEYREAALNPEQQEERIQNLLKLKEDAAILPRIVALLHRAAPEADRRLARETDPTRLRQLIESTPGLTRAQRKQLLFSNITIDYTSDIEDYAPGAVPQQRRTAPSAGPGGTGGYGPGGYGGGTGGYGPGGYGGGTGGYGPGGYGDRFGEGPGRQPREQEDAGEGQKGFYVRVTGRLLYGQSQAEASQVLTEEYFKRLEELGQRQGLGFHVLRQDPAADEENFTLLKINPLYRVEGVPAPPTAPTALRAPGVPAADDAAFTDPAYTDPITGETTLNDWVFDFGFKIALGDAPAEEEADAETTDNRTAAR